VATDTTVVEWPAVDITASNRSRFPPAGSRNYLLAGVPLGLVRWLPAIRYPNLPPAGRGGWALAVMTRQRLPRDPRVV